MTLYKITMNSISGAYMADSPIEALDIFAQDAGYKDWKDACDQNLASDNAVVIESDEYDDSALGFDVVGQSDI